jgi:hypothetical protein
MLGRFAFTLTRRLQLWILPVLVLVWFSVPFGAGYWTTSSLSLPRCLLIATSLPEHNLSFFAGGQDVFLNTYTPLAVVDIYNASSNTWTNSSLSYAGWSGAATTVADLALFAGGTNNASGLLDTAVVDIYNASSNNWTTASLSKARAGLAATSVGSLALFAGGWNGAQSPVVDIYNVSSNNWTTASLSLPRQWLAATSVGGLALFAGGYYAPSASSDYVDIYIASSNNWTTASLSQPRFGLAATTVADLALFAGGTNNASGLSYSAVVDIYNASSNNWTTASLSQPRAWLAATTVSDLALFAGGIIANTPSDVVDIYNATSNSWTTASLSEARGWLAATALKDRAIIAGGCGATTESSVVDMYDDFAFVYCTNGSQNPSTQCNGNTVSFNQNQPTFQLQSTVTQNISVETTLFNVQSSSGTSLDLPLVWQSQLQTIALINSSSTSSAGLVYTTSNANYTLEATFAVISNSTTVQLISGLAPVQAFAQSVKFAWSLTLHSLSLFASNQDTLSWSFDIILNNLNPDEVIIQPHDSGQYTIYQVTDNNQNTVVNLLLENEALLDNTTIVKVNSSVVAERMGDGSSVLKVDLTFPAFTFSLMYDPNLSLSVLQPSLPGSSNSLYYLFLLGLVPIILVVAVLIGVFVAIAIYSARKKNDYCVAWEGEGSL